MIRVDNILSESLSVLDTSVRVSKCECLRNKRIASSEEISTWIHTLELAHIIKNNKQ